MRHVATVRRPAYSTLGCSSCDHNDLAGLDGLGSFLKKVGKKLEKTVKKVAVVAAPIVGAVVGGPAGLQIGAQIGGMFAPTPKAETLPPDMYVQQAPIQTMVPTAVAPTAPAAGAFDLNQFIAQNKTPLMLGGGFLFLTMMMQQRGR